MESPSVDLPEVGAISRRIGHRLLTITENRFELMMLELEEERDRIFKALWLTLGMVAFLVLAGLTFTGLIVLLLWQHSPWAALAIVTAIYATMAAILYGKLKQLRRDWESFPATLEELRKDRECLAKNLN